MSEERSRNRKSVGQILWEPVSTGMPLRRTRAPSDLVTLLDDAFGQFPITLEPKQAFVLRAMAVASDDPNSLNEIASLLDEHGAIRLWAESAEKKSQEKPG